MKILTAFLALAAGVIAAGQPAPPAAAPFLVEPYLHPPYRLFDVPLTRLRPGAEFECRRGAAGLLRGRG